MKQFFITVNTTQPKNKLEKALHSAFENHAHKLINELDISLLKTTYEEVLAEYNANKGKAFVSYSLSKYSDVVFISMGDSLHIHLSLVTGIINS